MANNYFRFKQFEVYQHASAMKVTTDACLFGAWAARLESSFVEKKRMLDVGAGTGLLTLMMAQQNNAIIDAVEIESGAAAEAKANFARSPWPDRLNLLEGNILDTLPGLNVNYHVVFSNPPFYEHDLASPGESRRMAHHESGLQLQPLVARMDELLNAEGRYYLLFSAKRESALLTELATAGLAITQIARVRPTSSSAFSRVMVAGRRARPGQSSPTESELLIHTEEKKYSADFISLLHPYYLYL
ncbi:MAG: tRNA1(Val) (adenine(37)-N6)-methyltransferase [Chitinophagaceae bacterium]